jgi:hypothetical protein
VQSASATFGRFCALPRRERAVVMEAGILLSFASAAVRWLPDRALYRLLISAPARRNAKTTSPQRLLALIEATADRLPFAVPCLARAIAEKWMLTRRTIPASLIVGVRTRDRFAAHAWVDLSDPPATPGEYHEIWRHP